MSKKTESKRRIGSGPSVLEVLGRLQAECVKRNTVPCEGCGKLVEIGCWPSCPHENIGAYSFSGKFR